MTSTSTSSDEDSVPLCDEPHVILLEGEIDLLTAPAITDPIKRLAASGPSMVVLDFERVTFIDSTGLSALLVADRSLPRVRALPPPALGGTSRPARASGHAARPGAHHRAGLRPAHP